MANFTAFGAAFLHPATVASSVRWSVDCCWVKGSQPGRGYRNLIAVVNLSDCTRTIEWAAVDAESLDSMAVRLRRAIAELEAAHVAVTAARKVVARMPEDNHG